MNVPFRVAGAVSALIGTGRAGAEGGEACGGRGGCVRLVLVSRSLISRGPDEVAMGSSRIIVEKKKMIISE
jgi:hypothetical protein